MTIALMEAAWTESPHQQSALLLHVALAEWADVDGVSWRHVKRIAERCRQSERQTHRLLRQLADTGDLYIHTGRGRGLHSFYMVMTGRSEDEITEALVRRFDLELEEARAVAVESARLREPARRAAEERAAQARAEAARNSRRRAARPVEPPAPTPAAPVGKGDAGDTFSPENMTSRVEKYDIQGQENMTSRVKAPAIQPVPTAQNAALNLHGKPTRKERESRAAAATPPPRKHDPPKGDPTDRELRHQLARICGWSPDLLTAKQNGQLRQSLSTLQSAREVTPESLQTFARWFAAEDWRGKKGERPTPGLVVELWDQAGAPPPTTAPAREEAELAQRIAELYAQMETAPTRNDRNTLRGEIKKLEDRRAALISQRRAR